MTKPSFDDTQVVLSFHVIPGAKKNEISEIMDQGVIKIKISAPPVEGKANQAILQYLKEILTIRSSQIEIIGGEKSRNKTIRFVGIPLEKILKILSNNIKK